MSLDRDRSTEIPYPLRMDRPPTIRSSIHGRGTTCWYAKHPREKIDIVIKDSWRSDGRRPEYEYLLPSQGIHGVVVLVSFQDKCGETNWIRIDPDMQEQGNSEGYCNRIKLRLVMEQAGLDVSHFKSRYQFISAMRDAILGKSTFVLCSEDSSSTSLLSALFASLEERDTAPGHRYQQPSSRWRSWSPRPSDRS